MLRTVDAEGVPLVAASGLHLLQHVQLNTDNKQELQGL